MKLSGWQRLGVVLTGLWIIRFVGCSRHDQMTAAQNLYELQLGGCADLYINSTNDPAKFPPCAEDAGRLFNASLKLDARDLMDAALFAAISAAIVWLVVWLASRLVLWVRAGFRKETG